MAFMARLRAAAGESPLALRLRFRSWLRPVRRKWPPAAADSAVAAAERGRNGGLLTLVLFQLRTARNKLRSFPRKRRQGRWRRRRGEARVRSRYVRFTSNSHRIDASRGTDAMCKKRTSPDAKLSN